MAKLPPMCQNCKQFPASGLWSVHWHKGSEEILHLCASCGLVDMAHARKSRFSDKLDAWYTYDTVERVDLIASFTRSADEAKATIPELFPPHVVVTEKSDKKGLVKKYVYL